MKVLFALSSLHCGGIEKSALTLLSRLVERGDAVTLSVAKKEGEFLPYVPKGVPVTEIPYDRDVRDEMRLGRKKMIVRLVAHGRWVEAVRLALLAKKLLGKNADRRAIEISKRFCASLPVDGTVYDLAICFSEFTELVYVADHVKAKRKAVWLHTEQGEGFANAHEYIDYLRKMDDIYCVSDALKTEIERRMPELKDKVRRYHHIVDGELIRSMAEQEDADWPVASPDSIKILSVGRLAVQKGFDLIPKIVKVLNGNGIRVSWMVLGEGSERSAIEKMASDEGVSDQMMMPGVKVNPYPYFKACDIYVQPSRYEGYCLTVAEARMFCKPIVATDFNGAREQLKDGRLGVIVPCDVDALAAAIEGLLRDSDKRNAFIDGLTWDSQRLEEHEIFNNHTCL